MKSHENRVKQMEQKVRPTKRQFVGWQGHSWTPEQEAEALRRHPEKTFFWRSLLEAAPDCAVDFC